MKQKKLCEDRYQRMLSFVIYTTNITQLCNVLHIEKKKALLNIVYTILPAAFSSQSKLVTLEMGRKRKTTFFMTLELKLVFHMGNGTADTCYIS